MSVAATQPIRTAWLYAGLFLVTMATLMLEVLDTRLLSVLTWYHLSFVAVSMAMLGMAAGAVLVFLGGDLFDWDRVPGLLPFGTLLFAFAIVLCHIGNLVIPIPAISGFAPRADRGARRRDAGAHHSVRRVGRDRHRGVDANACPGRRAVCRGSRRRRLRLPRDRRAARTDRHHVERPGRRGLGVCRGVLLRPLRRPVGRRLRAVGAGTRRRCPGERERPGPARDHVSEGPEPLAADRRDRVFPLERALQRDGEPAGVHARVLLGRGRERAGHAGDGGLCGDRRRRRDGDHAVEWRPGLARLDALRRHRRAVSPAAGSCRHHRCRRRTRRPDRDRGPEHVGHRDRDQQGARRRARGSLSRLRPRRHLSRA